MGALLIQDSGATDLGGGGKGEHLAFGLEVLGLVEI